MVRFLKFLVIALIAIPLLAFAFANRQVVTVSFDPFSSGDARVLTQDAPLFIVLIVAVALGVIAGGIATWLSQGKHRRAARAYRAEVERLRADLQEARGLIPAGSALARRA